MGVKIYAIELNHLTKMTDMPIYDKNLKQNLLLQNQLTDDLENWYVALGCQVLQRLFKICPWADLDPLYAKVGFGLLGFCIIIFFWKPLQP